MAPLNLQYTDKVSYNMSHSLILLFHTKPIPTRQRRKNIHARHLPLKVKLDSKSISLQCTVTFWLCPMKICQTFIKTRLNLKVPLENQINHWQNTLLQLITITSSECYPSNLMTPSTVGVGWD